MLDKNKKWGKIKVTSPQASVVTFWNHHAHLGAFCFIGEIHMAGKEFKSRRQLSDFGSYLYGPGCCPQEAL